MQRCPCAANALAAERLLGLVERVGRVAVGKQVAELALVVGADVLVQRDGRVRCPERLVNVLAAFFGLFAAYAGTTAAAALTVTP